MGADVACCLHENEGERWSLGHNHQRIFHLVYPQCVGTRAVDVIFMNGSIDTLTPEILKQKVEPANESDQCNQQIQHNE